MTTPPPTAPHRMQDPDENQECFADAFSRALDRRDLTLDRIVHHLHEAGHHLSAATLSYWRSGRSVPQRAASLRAVEELERILDTPHGELVGAVAHAHGEAWQPTTAIPGTLDLSRLRAAGLDIDRHVNLLSLHETLRLHHEADHHSVTTRVLLRSHHPRVQRFAMLLPVLTADDPGLASPQPVVEALLGCNTAPAIAVASDERTAITTFAVPVALPRALHPGQLAALELRTTWHIPGLTDGRFLRPTPEPVRHLGMALHTPHRAALHVTHTHDAQHCHVSDTIPTQHHHTHAPAGLHTMTWRHTQTPDH